jgi:YebC/PmpR family DNA-binding regulatory protein
MSGHSKWSKIKRQKASGDAKRGQLFTKIGKMITLSVSESGGNTDINQNSKLRIAIEKAKSINMPKDTIDRAVERGTGKGGKDNQLLSARYEAYGPGGSGILIEAVTDNGKRTASEIKNILDKSGGTLGAPGSVAFQFDHLGMIVIQTGDMSEDDLLQATLDLPIINFSFDSEDKTAELTVQIDQIHQIRSQLEKKQFSIIDSSLVYVPKQTIQLSNLDHERKLLSLLHALEDLDDVQEVYTNIAFSN